MGADGVVIALHGMSRSDLASALDTIAIMASRMSAADLPEFAGQLAADVARAPRPGPVRAAMVAADPTRLTTRAKRAAHLVRTSVLLPPLAGPGMYLSDRALGRVVVVFSGLADTPLAHTQTLAAAEGTLTWLADHGVRPRAAVGYGLGEIVALSWGGCLPPQEAARLTALRAEVLKAAPRDTGLARVIADPAATGELANAAGVHIAAWEGPRQHLIAGTRPAIHEMHRLAGPAGIRDAVLDTASALHTATLGALTPAMRGALATAVVRAPRRQVALASVGRQLSPQDDIAELLARHLAEPARLECALAAAVGNEADLIVTPPGDPDVAAALATCGTVPVVQAPDPLLPLPDPAATAALFAAGAITAVS